MDHDRTARVDALCMRPRSVRSVGIRDVNRQEIVAVGLAAVEHVMALGRSEIALALLRAVRDEPERNSEGLEDAPRFQQIELTFRLHHEHGVGYLMTQREREVGARRLGAHAR